MQMGLGTKASSNYRNRPDTIIEPHQLFPEHAGQTERRSLVLLFHRALGLGLFGLAVIGTLDYPFGSFFLLAGIIGYLIILYRYPHAWLLLLPTLLPLLNLAPWSGRLLIEEFDLFLLTTVAAGLLHGAYHRLEFPKMARLSWLLIISLSFSYFISIFIGLLPLDPLDANAFSNYLSHYNSLRVSRGFLWALLLAPLLYGMLAENNEQTSRSLILGVQFGLIGVGFIIFWERGIIADLFNSQTIYSLFSSFLDFTSEYRITALFSDMHTGGSAIDGYISLALPFALGAPLIYHRYPHLIIIAATALILGTYTTIVTFTRITYLAFAVSIFIFLIGIFISRLDIIRVSILIEKAIFIIIAIGLFFYGYSRGGILVLSASLLAFFTSMLLGFVKYRFSWLTWNSMLIAAFIVFSSLIARGLLTSKWVYNSSFEAMFIASILATAFLSIGARIGFTAMRIPNIRHLIGMLVFVILAAAVSIPATLGYRMDTRFSESSKDIENRIEHWQTVLSVMNRNWSSLLFGTGIGTFPRSYILNVDDARYIGTYTIWQEPPNTFLRLAGGEDLEIGQRIFLSKGDYQLYLALRNTILESSLDIRICERNLMHAANCKYFRAKTKDKDGFWQHISITINIDDIGQKPWYERWPTVFLISNHHKDSIIDIDNIELFDKKGNNLISNGNFEHGGDRWFSYNEFSHLPWHTKNLWLHIYFEQGWFGIITFLALLVYTCSQLLNRTRKSDYFALIILSSIGGFLTVGLTGSILDAPRVAILFYLILLGAVFYVCNASTHKPAVCSLPFIHSLSLNTSASPIRRTFNNNEDQDHGLS